ncbi:RDD family protein [Chelatococcus sp. SYSU_G07232]|uniref:RDD family protein n=1 Tax=Chelatococcus albus TaxID=3047466 RepID=A0ABT7AC50_9HYPH|nr:RDD family protein [Chelatococcus sp. SYSU_G07232]MDJ1156944.1 RDD family protein [Chelatococcus sp. SYSU_G07232]
MSNDPRAVTAPNSGLQTRGVLGGRFVAYLVDLCVIAVLTFVLAVVIALLGVVTLGIAWLLFPILAATGVFYSIATVGGRRQATIGMRLFGLKVTGQNGTRVDPIIAGAHALFFYVAASTMLLLALDILIGLVRDDRRLLHDLLTGVTVVRVGV